VPQTVPQRSTSLGSSSASIKKIACRVFGNEHESYELAMHATNYMEMLCSFSMSPPKNQIMQ
jgi:hypothetical protein